MSKIRFIATGLLILPAVWCSAQTVPTWFYSGWNHDPRFYAIYLPGFLVVRWVGGQACDWVSPRYAVTVQDTVVAVALTLGIAFVLSRWRLWQEHAWLRHALAVLSLVLPWFGVVRPSENAGRYGVAVLPLMAAYVGSVLAVAAGRLSAGMRRSLLVIALVSGGTVVLWGLDESEWLYASSILASFFLLSVAAIRSTLDIAWPHNDELQPTKPAPAMEPRR